MLIFTRKPKLITIEILNYNTHCSTIQCWLYKIGLLGLCKWLIDRFCWKAVLGSCVSRGDRKTWAKVGRTF